jgi:hypothetical protein
MILKGETTKTATKVWDGQFEKLNVDPANPGDQHSPQPHDFGVGVSTAWQVGPVACWRNIATALIDPRGSASSQ